MPDPIPTFYHPTETQPNLSNPTCDVFSQHLTRSLEKTNKYQMYKTPKLDVKL